MPTYNQHAIISKINRYLWLNKRRVKFKQGYCHGITLLWLYKMSIGQEEWFYKTVENIASCKSRADFDKFELDFEKFIAHIEWLQNSNKYVNNINQLNLDTLLELPKDLSLSSLFNMEQLEHVLNLIIHEDKMICLSGSDHTIGVYNKSGKIYLYDPNYINGKPKNINDIESLKLEIYRCLYMQNSLSDKKFPLEINIVNNTVEAQSYNIKQMNDSKKMSSTNTKYQNVNKKELYNELLNSLDTIDEAGLSGITNLYLACESGDKLEVKKLLGRHADPNQVCNQNWTPLLIASTYGYTDIAKLLIKKGANPHFGNRLNHTPLYLAAKYGHEDIVKLLLDSGANPTTPSKDGITPIRAAISNERWTVIVHLLIHCNHSRDFIICKKDKEEIRKNKKPIIEAAQQIYSSLSFTQKSKLTTAMGLVFKDKTSHGFFSKNGSRRENIKAQPKNQCWLRDKKTTHG